jgi:class 3 adenylate cyclase
MVEHRADPAQFGDLARAWGRGHLWISTVDAGIAKSKAAAAKTVATVCVVVEDVSLTLEDERKTPTALFADIKGSTESMRDLDPEEARAIVDSALKLMIDAVHRYDGYVVQSTAAVETI